jgi:hypothetical protein
MLLARAYYWRRVVVRYLVLLVGVCCWRIVLLARIYCWRIVLLAGIYCWRFVVRYLVLLVMIYCWSWLAVLMLDVAVVV